MRSINYGSEKREFKRQLTPDIHYIRSLEYCINNQNNIRDYLNTALLDYSAIKDIGVFVANNIFELAKYRFLQQQTENSIRKDLNIEDFYIEGENIWEV